MIPITQTELYDPTRPNHRGNCWQTVIASILDLPLDEVPHFVQDEVDHPGDGDWDWWVRTCRWLNAHDLRLVMVDVATCRDEYVLATGPSPRGNGVFHVVIYRDGAMVHDPHPDRSGLTSVDFNGYVIRDAVAIPTPNGDR